MRHHRQLQWSDRLRIEAWRRVGMRVDDIASELGVHRVTVYRELKRGVYEHTNTDLTTEMRYNPDLAERKYQDHLRAKGPEIKLGNDYKLAAFIERLIRDEKYSPSAALHEIERRGEKFSTTISSTTLYRYIDKGVFLDISNDNLPIGKRKKKVSHTKQSKRPERGPSIEKRPFAMLDRSEFGHWEMDTVVGRRGSKKVFLVLTERYSRYEIVRIMQDRTAASVVKEVDGIERRMGKRNFKQIFKSITMDNGAEFADYENIARKERTQVYFCHPYHSCERGSNENQNRLVRRHYPKGVSLSKVTKQDAQRLQEWINNYPRSIFAWNSAADIFNACVNSLA